MKSWGGFVFNELCYSNERWNNEFDLELFSNRIPSPSIFTLKLATTKPAHGYTFELFFNI